MTSEYPAGLTHSDIDFILGADPEVLSSERIEGAKSMWRVSVRSENNPPVQVLIDNGINEIYVQCLLQIDTDHIVEALQALQPYGVVGLVIMNDMLFMRSGFYAEHSTMHVLTNSYRALAYAYWRYQAQIAGL